MQRRAAAAYLALFLVVCAGAYAVIGVAEKPAVELDSEPYTEGDQLTVDQRVYDVTGVSGGTGELQWTDSDAIETNTLENNTNVSWQTVTWAEREVDETTLDAGSTLEYNGSFYRVGVNASTDPPTMTLARATDESINETFEVGDTVSVTLDGQFLPDRTVSEITSSSATLAVGDDYHVGIAPDNESANLTQQFNATRLLVENATLDDEVLVNGTGVRLVQNTQTGETIPLEDVLPEQDYRVITEGDTLVYEGNETTVGTISTDVVELNRTAPQTNSVGLEEGASVTLGPDEREFFVHFPDNSSVQIVENTTSNWEDYQSQLTEIDSYNERTSGLWGVVYLSFLGALIIGAAAYLPVKD